MNKIVDALSKLWDRVVSDYESRFDIAQTSHGLLHLINSLVILLGAWLAIKVVKTLIRRFEFRVGRIHGAAYRRRIETVMSVTVSSIKYAVYTACIFWVLSEWGINTDSLLVGTAVIGAAIGFGAQGIVQDVITGLSMLAEDQLAVGDFVEIAGKTGAVEEVGLRVIKIRDALGAQHVIFNRMINMVSNFKGGTIQAWVDVFLENAEAGEKAVTVAGMICKDIAAELPHFPRAPEVVGVRTSQTGELFLRIDAVVLPKQELVLRTHFTDRIKSAFAANGIKIPQDRIRVAISSDLFRQAMDRGKKSGVLRVPPKVVTEIKGPLSTEKNA